MAKKKNNQEHDSDDVKHVTKYERFIWAEVVEYERDQQTRTDLVNDCYAAVIASWATFSGKAKRSSWITAVARNVCRAHQRKAAKGPVYGYDEDALAAIAIRGRFAKSSAQVESDGPSESDEAATAVVSTARVDSDIGSLDRFNGKGLPRSIKQIDEALWESDVRAAVIHARPAAKTVASMGARIVLGPRSATWSPGPPPMRVRGFNFSHTSMTSSTARDWRAVPALLSAWQRQFWTDTSKPLKVAAVTWDTVVMDNSEVLEREEQGERQKRALQIHVPEDTDAAYTAALKEHEKAYPAAKPPKRARGVGGRKPKFGARDDAFMLAVFLWRNAQHGTGMTEWARREVARPVSSALVAFVEKQGNDALARLLRARPTEAAHLKRLKRLHERYDTEPAFRSSVDGDLELIRHAERHGAL